MCAISHKSLQHISCEKCSLYTLTFIVLQTELLFYLKEFQIYDATSINFLYLFNHSGRIQQYF